MLTCELWFLFSQITSLRDRLHVQQWHYFSCLIMCFNLNKFEITFGREVPVKKTQKHQLDLQSPKGSFWQFFACLIHRFQQMGPLI